MDSSTDFIGMRRQPRKRQWAVLDWILAGPAGAPIGPITARKSLSHRFIIYTLALFSVFWIIYLPIQTIATWNDAHKNANTHTLHIYESTRNAFRHAVWTFDSEATLQLIRGVESFELIERAWVDTPNSGVLGKPLENPSGRVLTFDLHAPEEFERSETIGKLTIVIDNADINRHIIVALASRVTLVAACLLVLAWVIRLLFRRLIGNPLADIADYVSRPDLIENPPNTELFKGREDEIGLMAETLQSLVFRGHENLKKISEYQTNLEELVAERTEQLKQVQGELVQAENLAALGALVAGVSHELNTPLGNAMVAATTIDDASKSIGQALNDETLTRAELQEQAERIEESAAIIERTLGRVRELVGNFRQVAVDRQSAMKRNFNFDNVVEQTLATLQPSLRKTPYKMDLDLKADISLKSYPGAISQVLSNLVENAVKHGFEGRPNGTIRLETRLVGDEGRAAGEHSFSMIEFTCRDDGRGIPEKNLKKVFEPFFTTKFGKGGSGLGMSIAYQLVTEVLHGTIGVDSQFGLWTKFTIRIPLEETAADQMADLGEGAR